MSSVIPGDTMGEEYPFSRRRSTTALCLGLVESKLGVYVSTGVGWDLVVVFIEGISIGVSNPSSSGDEVPLPGKSSGVGHTVSNSR